MQHARAQEGIEMSMCYHTMLTLPLSKGLREHLLAASGSGSGSAPAPYPPPPSGPQQGAENPYPPSDSQSPHDRLDPNVTGQYDMSGDADGADRKGKRELSTSKRAAQNRAAQRAFRQRKEGYIKKLEEQVKEFQTMEQNYKTLQNENYQLREYILGLQSRLLENQADFPPAPSHVNLSSGASSQPQHVHAAERPSYGAEEQLRREMEQQRAPPAAPVVAREDVRHDGMTQLQQAAAAADARPHTSPYGLGNSEYQKRPEDSNQATSSSDAKPPS
ncbi:putative transcription factor kapC [Pseudocercospora fuligena]|uniref:Putative transcription factor kapC n=1 Tax=Pseudocercospora fuligena TaxID=685502 RepID=A0A8H6RD20_9PEZI|nr:putative transcription factor kapC [Pseudocercospora fuligena]